MLKINILVVKSHDELNELAKQLKQRVENVIVVNDSKEAKEVINNSDIDIVLTDALPLDDGVEIVRYAITHELPIIPAVVMSTYKEFISEWENLPYIQVLHRPTNINILYDNIISVLKQSNVDMSENYIDTINGACNNARTLLEELENLQ